MHARKRAPFAALIALALLGAGALDAHAAARSLARPAIASASGVGAAPTLLSNRSALDAAGNTYFAWVDTRGPWGSGIFAQKLNAAGVPQWSEGGVAVSLAPGYQSDPTVVADAAGGIWVVWEHDPSDDMLSTDIHAQQFDDQGNALWAANGIVVCDAANRQTSPQAVRSGSGGVIVTWQDRRGGSLTDIYAQLMSGDGIAAWTANGVAVCTAADDQRSPQVVTDGSHGAYVAWTDERVSETEEAIYVQHLSRFGVALWAANGLPVTTTWTDQFSPVLVSDGNGGAIVGWVDLSPTFEADLRAQRFAPSGERRWGTGGLAVCAAAEVQMSPVAVADGANGAVFAWTDLRSDTDGDFYAQRFDSTGAALWTADGVVVCDDTTGAGSLAVTSDAAGGAFFVWRDQRASAGFDLYAQRLDATGARPWGATAVMVCEQRGYELDPELTPDGAGGMVVSWVDTRSRQDHDVYAQRLDAAGAVQWTAHGAPVFEVGVQGPPEVVAVGGGATMYAWAEKRSGQYDVRVARREASGAPSWAAVGVCAAADQQHVLALADDGAGGAFVAWLDYRSGADQPDLYAQHVNSGGSSVWTTDGVPVCVSSDFQNSPGIVSDGAGGAIVVFDDNRGGVHNVYAQRLDASGVPQWTANGVLLCALAGEHGSPMVVSDGAGGAIVVFQDDPGGFQPAMRAQRVSAAGTLPWGADGVALHATAAGAMYPDAAPDGAGGVFVAWTDFRVQPDIYAQHVRADGSLAWTSEGVPVASAGSVRAYPAIAADGAGGALVSWAEESGGSYDARAQRVDSTGAAVWAAGGVDLCTAAGDQFGARVVADGSGGLIACWEDRRTANDIAVYAQRLNGSGVAQWTAGGIAVADTAWTQALANIVSDGSGGAVLGWWDQRQNGLSHVMAQRLDGSGNPLWGASGVVPTALSLARMYATSDGAHLEWYAASAAHLDAVVQRREEAGEWNDLALVTGGANGLLVFDDLSVTPGARYAYRLLVADGALTRFSPETWVSVPLRARVSLASPWPNPATRELRVAFSLTGTAPARLELLDLAGRVARRWTLDGFGAGEHAVALSDARAFAPGVYVLRLSEGAARAQRRVTIVR